MVIRDAVLRHMVETTSFVNPETWEHWVSKELPEIDVPEDE